MAQSSLVKSGLKIWALESPLALTQMCTLCVNLSRVWNGTELQLPHLCDGDNCGTQA